MAKTIATSGFEPSESGLDSNANGSSFANNPVNQNPPSKTTFGNPPRNGWELLSRDQIEAEYGLTRRWLELAAHRGAGPPRLQISRRMVRYRRDVFEAWLSKHVIDNSAA